MKQCVLEEHPLKTVILIWKVLLVLRLLHGADAIHPGFGFLSENPQFAKLCKQCNITYIGPDYTVIEKMGNKVAARQTMINAKIPVVPGTNNEIKDLNHALQEAEKTGYPVIVKAGIRRGRKRHKSCL